MCIRDSGDAILAVFGVPDSHEDDAVRAVHAALGMQQALRQLNLRLAGGGPERRGSVHLAMRIGIHTGLVVSRVTEGEGMFLVSGDTVNLAARLQEAAEPGAVLVSDATQRLVAHAFATEPLGPIHVKGKAEPVTVFQVKTPWSEIDRPRRFDSPLIGRQAELRVLQERIAQLRAGKGGVVTICGEAGIGKSRLVAEVHRHIRALDTSAFPALDHVPRWVEGRCVSSRISPPYALWIDILRIILDVPQDASAQETAFGVHAWLQENACGRHEDLFPPLARLFGPAIELDGEPAIGDAETQRRVLRDAVRTVLCLLYTSPSPRDRTRSRMPSSA